MASKHHYSQPAPSNMQPQRGGTPRNTGSPPPDLPPESYRRPAQTQAAKEHQWTPQPNARPGEGSNMAKQGSAPMNGPAKPTGTAVPERRAAKSGAMGGVPGSVGQEISVPGDAFSVASPSPTPGYKPPGRPTSGRP
jgi:hypothetical protein